MESLLLITQDERNQLRAALERIAHERPPEEIDEAEWLRAIARDAIRHRRREE